MPKATGGKIISAVRPNVGIQASYQKALDDIIGQMHRSVLYWLSASYKANEPEALALDSSPASRLNARMKRLARQWQKKFDQLAPALAAHFAKAATERSDASLRAALKRGGMTVAFRPTPAVRDVLQATINQNVSLIKSIGAEHLQEVSGLVMRSVAAGRDLGYLTKELEARYGITRRRAAFISRSQNNMTTSTIQKVRQQELGIIEALWAHSHGGVHPRPSHLAADGKRYTISEGMMLDGERTWPGLKPGCRCVSRSIVPGLS